MLFRSNTMTGYFGAGPITDINNFIGGEEFFPLPIGINTYACAEVFGGDGTPGADNGYKFSTESLSTIVDEEGRNYDVYECIPGNLLVLPSSSYFNLSSYTFNSNHPQNPSSLFSVGHDGNILRWNISGYTALSEDSNSKQSNPPNFYGICRPSLQRL